MDPTNLSPIFKLDQELDQVFDWLEMFEMISFGQTCKTFNRVVGEYLQRRCIRFDASPKKAYLGLSLPIIRYEGDPWKNFDEHLNDFIPYLTSITVRKEFTKYFTLSDFKSIKRVHFSQFTLTESFIKSIKNILSQAEIIDFGSSCHFDMDGGAYENVYKHCPNLKCLNSNRVNKLDVLPQKYSESLEFLTLLYADHLMDFNDFKIFFDLNPKVDKFMTDLGFITDLYNWIKKNSSSEIISNIKLKDLTIIEGDLLMSNIIDILNYFYDCGFYKRLHYYGSANIEKQQLQKFPGLVTLHIDSPCKVELPPLPDLKELGFNTSLTRLREEGLNLVEIPNLYINLERLFFRKADPNDILPFIRHSRKLRQIDIRVPENFNAPPLDFNISALNNERKRLSGANKVIIYVRESEYISTKWGKSDTNFSLIEIRRQFFIPYNGEHDLRLRCPHMYGW